jgi:hypothetical protein
MPIQNKLTKAMQSHFCNKHKEDTIIIEEEGPLLHCHFCGIFQRTVGEEHIQARNGQQ